jgi:hypothetical protein
MAKEWQTFVRKFEDMKEGEIDIFVKDLTPGPKKYDTRHVMARIARSRKTLPKGDILWVRGESGLKSPKPWFIKIQKELPEWVAGKPWTNVLDAAEKASLNEK